MGSRDHHGNFEPESARIVGAAGQYDYNEGEHTELAPATGSPTGVLTNSGHLVRAFARLFERSWARMNKHRAADVPE